MASAEIVSNLKLITSGNVPTTSNLGNGELAFGLVGGVAKLYGNVNGTIVDFSDFLRVAPVTSVADKTGAVALNKSDVGLENVANERQYSAENPPPYPVVPNGNYQDMTVGNSTKLNGKTSEQIRTKVFRTNQVLNTTVDGFTAIHETAVVEPNRENVVAGDIVVDTNNTIAIATEDFDSGAGIFSVQTRSSVPIATTSVLGKVKSSTTGTTSGRDYKVQVNTDGTMKVNVPWTDTQPDLSPYATKTNANNVSMVPLSGTATTLSTPSSGGVLTISANGWLRVSLNKVTANGQYCGLVACDANGTDKWGGLNIAQSFFANTYPIMFLPVKAGDHFKITYSISPLQIQLIKTATI